MKDYLEEKNAMVKLIAPTGGTVMCDDNMDHEVDAALFTTESVLFDALYIPGGKKSIEALKSEGKVFKFIHEMYKHCKAMAFDGEAKELLDKSMIEKVEDDKALFINGEPKAFAKAISQHRNWDREKDAMKLPI